MGLIRGLATTSVPSWGNANNPYVGYDNYVTTANIMSTLVADDTPSFNVDYPPSNLANPATDLLWKGANTDPIYLTVDEGTNYLCDYIAVARHNWGTGKILVSVETRNQDDLQWVERIPPTQLKNDAPVLFNYARSFHGGIRLKLDPQENAESIKTIPQAAVVYAGALLVLQRRIYVGHTPLPYGRTFDAVNGLSEEGEFLGRIMKRGTLRSSVDLQNITPDWYRQYLDPFIVAAQEKPFFFAWRPGTYPDEVGYAWITNNPQMMNQRANGMVQTSLQLEGLAR